MKFAGLTMTVTHSSLDLLMIRVFSDDMWHPHVFLRTP